MSFACFKNKKGERSHNVDTSKVMVIGRHKRKFHFYVKIIGGKHVLLIPLHMVIEIIILYYFLHFYRQIN